MNISREIEKQQENTSHYLILSKLAHLLSSSGAGLNFEPEAEPEAQA